VLVFAKTSGETQSPTARARAGEPPDARQELPAPARILADLLTINEEFQRKWTARARDFVADVLGSPRDRYLTFRHSWRFQEAFDAIRAGRGWTAIPAWHGATPAAA
jgi:hypothetical protein